LWDEEARLLRASAKAGSLAGSDEPEPVSTVSPDAIPELAAFLENPQAMVINTATAGSTVGSILADRGLGQVIVVPLLVDGRLHGVAAVGWSGSRHIGDRNGDLMARLRGVGQQAASALRNASLAERVRHQAEHDELTGLPNRRLFGARLDDAITGKRREDREAIGLLFCDLDGFKAINDRFGHAVGDELLRQVAHRLTSTVRDGDQVARLSGDEFAILLPRVVDAPEAEVVAGRIVAALAEPFDIDGRIVSITASVGIALDAQREIPGDVLLRDADQAMYAAKQAGRNQTAVFGIG
jgi:diguanylate cyclase (GGDEF)-like protein